MNRLLAQKLCPQMACLPRRAFSTALPSRSLTMEEIVNFCKSRAVIFPSSEIYDPIGTSYDYGPMGVQLKKNLQDRWWQDFVERRPDCIGLESAIILNPRVWEASGHVGLFVDPLSECKNCKKRVRVDKLIKGRLDALQEGGAAGAAGGASFPPDSLAQKLLQDPSKLASLSLNEMGQALQDLSICCPHCGAGNAASSSSSSSGKKEHAAAGAASPSSPSPATPGSTNLSQPRMFNLLFTTHVGPVMPGDQELSSAPASAFPSPSISSSPAALGASAPAPSSLKGSSSKKGSAAVAAAAAANPNRISRAFLRPETAQGVYINFPTLVSSSRRRLPVGIGQMGKSFRNEVSVSNFIFRTREFEQMELQYFCSPQESQQHFRYWVDYAEQWLTQRAGVRPENVRRKEYEAKELAHYALATVDLEYRYPFGWEELWGVANRGDYDLKMHQQSSGVSMMYSDPAGGKPFLPHAIEPALGLNRLLLAVLCDGLAVETLPAASEGAGEEAGKEKEKEKDSTAGGGLAANERIVFRVHEDLAPFKAAVLPVVKNKAELMAFSTELHAAMLKHLTVDFDSAKTIGKRYRRQDEMGTPLCVTVDSTSLSGAGGGGEGAAGKEEEEDGAGKRGAMVTVRDRDSMRQVRMSREEVLQRCASNAFKPSAIFK